MKKQITPCLWYDYEAEEAARFYVSVFKDSGIDHISYYGKEGHEIHGQKEDSVLTIDFHINGQPFTALNGGPIFKFNEAVSFQVFCETQEEIDAYWEKLSAVPESEQCGWLKDKFGVSWQIVPSVLEKLMKDSSRSERVTKAFMQMKKLDIQALLDA